MKGFVYILASGRHRTLYTGVTRHLVKRVHQHQTGADPGFTRRHDVKRLVHFEEYGLLADAIAREKRIKAWKRDWKIRLIEENNPEWDDLAPLLGFDPL